MSGKTEDAIDAKALVSDVKAQIEGLGETYRVAIKDLEEGQDETNAAVQEINATVTALKSNTDKWAKWSAEVEERLKQNRYGTGSSGDSLLAVIPDRHKSLVELCGRMGHNRDDAIKLAAFESWVKMVAQCQLPKFYQDSYSRNREDLDKLGKVLSISGGVTKADMQEGTDSEGGYTVPTPLEAELMRQINDAAVVRALARKIPMVAVTHLIPSLATGVTAAIVNEETSIGQDEPTFGQLSLTAKKIAVRGIMSMELLQDSALGILALYFSLAAESIAEIEDAQALEGDGTGSNFEGLVAATGVVEKTSGTNGDGPSHTRLVRTKWGAKKRATRARRYNAAFVCHPDVAAQIEATKDDNGQPIWKDTLSIPSFAPNLGDTGPDGIVIGYPLYTSEQVSMARTVGTSSDCGNAYFGPYGRSMIFGDLLGMSFAVSEHAGGVFEKAQVMARVLKRTAILVGVPQDFTKLTGIRAMAAAAPEGP